MIKFESFRANNSFVNFLLKFVNFLVHFLVGTINLLIEIGLYFYKILTKKYKYESIYIIICSLISFWFIFLSSKGKNQNQLYTIFGRAPSFIYLSFSVFTLLILGFGIFLLIKQNILKKQNLKFFWHVRIISYVVSFFVFILIFDFFVLDFISLYQTIKKSDVSISSYHTIVYFMKDYKSSFLDGIFVTLKLALFGTAIGLFLAFFMVLLRNLKIEKTDNDFIKLLKKIGSSFANIYVTVIRGTPMVVQAFIFYYLIAGIMKEKLSQEDYSYFLTNVWTAFRAGLFTVSINTTAYLTEVLRGGINSVDKGQTEAALALGFSKSQTMRLIVFPQAIKNSLPSIGNEFIINIKDTSVLTLIGIMDLFSVAKLDILGQFSGKSLEAYLIVGLYYLVLTFLTSKLLAYIERKMDMPVKGITSSN